MKFSALSLCWLLWAAASSLAADPVAAKPPPPQSAPAPANPDPDDADEVTAAKPATDPAAEPFWRALQLLDSESAADRDKGRTLLQEAADLEFPFAQLELAQHLQRGDAGFTKNPRRAAQFLRLAAERGNAFAQSALGYCYVEGTGVRRDRKLALGWLLKAVAADADYTRPEPPAWFREHQEARRKTAPASSSIAGELDSDPVSRAQAVAHFALAGLLAEDKKPAEAQEHFVRAAMAGPAGREGLYPAALTAAMNYAFGKGVPRDQAKAREMLEHSRKLMNRAGARNVHAYVQHKLVDEFSVGDVEEEIAERMEQFETGVQLEIAQTFGNPKSKDYNPAEAAKWYEVAAENDEPWAMLSLGLLYAGRELGPPDLAKAFQWFERAGGGDEPRHVLAAGNLGICYQHGLGVAADPAKAKAVFERVRDRDIVCYLGSIGRAPAAPVNYDAALELNRTWAGQGDARALYLLGRRYLYGYGVKADAAAAAKAFKQAADRGDALACAAYGRLLLRSRETAQIEKGIQYLEMGVTRGSAEACDLLASCHRLPRGLPGFRRDLDRAVELYQRSLEINYENAAAHQALAELLGRNNTKFPGTEDRAALQLRHLEEADRLGSAHAAFVLAGLAARGRADQPGDPRRAYVLMERAAERGHVDARFALGLMHERGLGVPVTYTEAAHHFSLAAAEGHREALRRLCMLYLAGKGVSKDFDRAAYWLYRLAQAGEYKALVALGDVATSKGEHTEAVKLWKVLLEARFSELQGFAHDRLSQCYRKGWGVKVNESRARTHAAKALELGNSDALYRDGERLIVEGKKAEGVAQIERAADRSPLACYSLGQMYYFGTNVSKDPKRAWEYLRRAARSDYPEALFFLAAATYNRAEGAPSLDEAIRFAAAAEAVGHPRAAGLREKLEKRREASGGGEPAPAGETAAPRST